MRQVPGQVPCQHDGPLQCTHHQHVGPLLVAPARHTIQRPSRISEGCHNALTMCMQQLALEIPGTRRQPRMRKRSSKHGAGRTAVVSTTHQLRSRVLMSLAECRRCMSIWTSPPEAFCDRSSGAVPPLMLLGMPVPASVREAIGCVKSWRF